jgi:ribonuclease HII
MLQGTQNLFYHPMKNRSILKHEQKYLDEGYNFVIGIDEAGRGSLAGPVVACAASIKSSSPVYGRGCPEGTGEGKKDNDSDPHLSRGRDIFSRLREKRNFNLIRDSKKLSEKQREELYNFICEHFYVGIGVCDHKTIDRINILEATYLAMKNAVTQLKSKIKSQNAKLQIKNKNYNTKYIILVDGNKKIPNISMEQKAIVGGDNIVKSISAASIIAKVTRDRMMKKMHERYPEYDFAKHKGYGTKLHMEKIAKHGPCEIHRRSFRPFI